MKLSAKTEYACLAMLQLAEDHSGGRPAPLRSLSARQPIPEGFLVQILQDLRRAGLVTSVRGASGGYQLSRSPEEVSLGDVIAAIEGDAAATAATSAATPLVGVLQSVCSEIRSEQRERLSALSLAELIDQVAGAHEPMWHI